ncbi:MAG: flagellar hook assembly protein FlgD [Sphingomonadales bacterium]|nr:flagellar hook assembly protein FlgD [Sphingomonadales bacterium]
MSVIDSISGQYASTADKSSTKLADDFDDFLTLLTTQLQVQDPLDPMDSSEFTNQLLQFTSVEQMISQNQNLEDIAALTAFYGMNDAVNYIGKDITVQQSVSTLSETAPARWIYELDAKAFENELEIKDADGNVVHTITGQTDQGSHSLSWDGALEGGGYATPGQYTLEVKALDATGGQIPQAIFMEGTVDGVEMEGGEALLSVGGFRIPLTYILGVTNKPASAATI